MSDLKKPFAVGDRVVSSDFGEGEVVHIYTGNVPFPVGVEFITGKQELYTIDGRWMYDKNQTLFHIESPPSSFDNSVSKLHEIAVPSNTLNSIKPYDYKRYFIVSLICLNKEGEFRYKGIDITTKNGKYINRLEIVKHFDLESKNLVIQNIIELSKEDYEEYTRTTDLVPVETTEK